MSTRVSSPAPPPAPLISTVEPAAPVTSVTDAIASTTPLDFLLVTSRIDFLPSCKRFDNECLQTGVHAHTLFVEDLPGDTPGEKLASLHQLNADWQASGKIASSTIKVALLHGGIGMAPVDASLDQFWQSLIGIDNSGSQPGQKSDAASLAPAKTHLLSAADDKLIFPTEQFDAALRAIVIDDGQLRAGFKDTIVYGACGSGVFREAARKTGGSYVFGSGKKSVFIEDFNAALCALVKDQGQRRREGSPLLSARDCWNLMRDVSGEHVALVGNETVEVNKILQSGHTEPRTHTRAIGTSPHTPTDVTAQGIRTLFAKIDHGSASSVEQVIARWGSDILSADHTAVMPGVALWSKALNSPRDAEQKIRLLLAHAPACLSQKHAVLGWLSGAIDRQWNSLLGELFRQMDAAAYPPLSLEEMVIWMRSKPDRIDKLMKLCRSSREITTAVSNYLGKVVLRQSGQRGPGYMSLPPFFDNLASKAVSRIRQSAAD